MLIKKKPDTLNLIFILLGGLVLLFIIAPLAGLFFATTPNELFETSKENEVIESIWLTLWTAMLGTTVFPLLIKILFFFQVGA